MHVWKPRWQFLDADDLIYLFCEMQITCGRKKFEDRWFPHTLKRHFKGRGVYYVWAPTLSMVDAKDLPYLTQFVKCIVPADKFDPTTPARIARHFDTNAAGDRVWKPDLEWLGLDELPYVVRYFDVRVSDKRFAQGNFPDRLRSHFREAVKEAA